METFSGTRTFPICICTVFCYYLFETTLCFILCEISVSGYRLPFHSLISLSACLSSNYISHIQLFQQKSCAYFFFFRCSMKVFRIKVQKEKAKLPKDDKLLSFGIF